VSSGKKSSQAEPRLRPPAISRKNWLFAGSRGGCDATGITTLAGADLQGYGHRPEFSTFNVAKAEVTADKRESHRSNRIGWQFQRNGSIGPWNCI
jgi:hypothetical protein